MPRGHALIIEDSSTARIILARLLEAHAATPAWTQTALLNRNLVEHGEAYYKGR